MEPQAAEPESVDATSEAGNEDPRPSPSRKKAARRNSLNENGGRESAQKRRRRAFSCLSCQRLKCRCEYDPGAQGCHRCQTLRCVDLLLRTSPPAIHDSLSSDHNYKIHVDWELTSFARIACSLRGQNEAAQRGSSAEASRLGVEERYVCYSSWGHFAVLHQRPRLQRVSYQLSGTRFNIAANF